ncbi:MAG: tetraprenyl-beta-curcumene synthase family protein [Deltaproteobacteria bacterium]|nr:tetraprenyl-beta-curcumene synthase family protein [Deltaproteobacteria bacterium]
MILQVQPVTHACLRRWKQRAASIPDPELRRQALASIAAKTFHCEGGSLYGLLAGPRYQEAIAFIVAYQTISDYLDNLCDRSTSQDPQDFRALHEAMEQALSPDAPLTAYYRFRREQDDGGYLAGLVAACRTALTRLPAYDRGAGSVRELASLYIDLQVHKHVRLDERVPRLRAWYDEHRDQLPPMSWFEFAACSGSTLGIFCIVSQLFNPATSAAQVDAVRKAYFPWVQGLHILLDYLIDQEEDRGGRDLNFCSFYENSDEITARLSHFYRQAQASVALLPDAGFHHLVNRGLLSIYLADHKVARQKDVGQISRKLLRLGGLATFFFYLHCLLYRRLT